MRYDQEIANLDHLLDLLEFGKYCIQDKNHHPEGDVLAHSVQVFNHAMREINLVDNFKFVVALAALLHDIGKISKPHGHAACGATLVSDFVSYKTTYLIENHMRFWNYQLGEMKRFQKIQDVTSFMFMELSLLARWDKMGRNPNVKIKYDRDKIIKQLTSLL